MPSLANMVPSEVMGAFILDRLEKVLVAGDVVNTEYAGVISAYGDSVKIPSLGDSTVSDYTKNSTLSYGNLDSSSQILNINQAKYFATSVDKIDDSQSIANIIPVIADRGASDLAKEADSYILQDVMPSGALTVGGTGNRALGTSGSPINVSISTTSASGVLSYLGRMAQRLDEADVPQEDRFAVVPPWFHNYLVINRVVSPALDSETQYQNGRIGAPVMGFDVRVSNNLTNATTTGSHIIAGHKSACAFAGNVVETRIFDMETKIATAVRSLYVYGAKAVSGKAIALGHITQS